VSVPESKVTATITLLRNLNNLKFALRCILNYSRIMPFHPILAPFYPGSKVSSYGTTARNTMRLTPAGIRKDEHAAHWEKKVVPKGAEGLPETPPGLVW
jgi:hypothetical protein